MWAELEPAQPLTWNWHLDVLCAELETQMSVHFTGAAPVIPGLNPATGTAIPWSQNVLMNVPPGAMKSLLVSVFLPAWMWLRKPSLRMIYASASDAVANRDSMKCRQLVESDLYRSRFGIEWTLARDQNAKSLFKNSCTGERQAVTVGQKIVGLRGDALFVDDPLDATKAKVEAADLEACKTWWDQAFGNRVNNAATSTRTIIMQRLHANDLSGHVLALAKPGEPGEFRHVVLPSEYEVITKDDPVRRPYDGDPRKTPGELLFPARFSLAVLAQEKQRMRSGYPGQHQQRPSSAEGDKFKRASWNFWRWEGTKGVFVRPQGCADRPPISLPQGFKWDQVWASIDTNQIEGDDNDYSVLTVVGVKGPNRFVLWRYRKQSSFTELEAAILQIKKEFPRCRRWLIEMKANGPGIYNTLKKKIPGLLPVPGTITGAGKNARAAVAEPYVESGNWYLPENAPWLTEWVDEFAQFPKGAHDDQVDTISQLECFWADSEEADAFRQLTGG